MNLSPPHTGRQPPLKIERKITELSANIDRKLTEDTSGANKSSQKLIRAVNDSSAIEIQPGLNDVLNWQSSSPAVKQKKTAKVKIKAKDGARLLMREKIKR